MMMDYPGKAITDQYPSRMLCGKRYDNGQVRMSFPALHLLRLSLFKVKLTNECYFSFTLGLHVDIPQRCPDDMLQ